MKAHLAYLNYVVRHKWFVFLACRKLGVPFWRSLKHDWHKFLASEWAPYVAYFYGPTVKLKDSEPDDYRYFSARAPVDLAFDRAWNMHQKRADHHWQYWVLIMDSGEIRPIQMSQIAACEMVADWFGAGRAITGKWSAKLWYFKNMSNITLHPRTREFVETLLEKTQKQFDNE